MTIQYNNLHHAFINELCHVVDYGEEITIRDLKVKEILNRSMTIGSPWQRCLFINHRNDNIFAKIAETLWMLSGRCDIEWLSRYVPRAIDYSDDGATWRGAYGPRLRKWVGDPEGWRPPVDQLWEVIKLLKKDPYTRRAVMTLWDPSVDFEDGKDIPCNNWLHFQVRDGNLHLNVAQRSSDVLWGFSGIDVFQWSVLMELVGFSIGVHCGDITYFISNLHLYEQHWKRASSILSDHDSGKNIYTTDKIMSPMITTFADEFFDELEKVFALEEAYREDIVCNDCELPEDMFLRECTIMLKVYNMFLNKAENDSIASVVSGMHTYDFKFAAIDYLFRQRGYEFLKELFLKPEERLIVERLCK